MRTLLRRLAYLVRLGRHTRELDEEMAFHPSLSGSSALCNTPLAGEDAKAIWISPSIGSVTQDLRYAARSLWRDKAFTLVSLRAVAAAIGLTNQLLHAVH